MTAKTTAKSSKPKASTKSKAAAMPKAVAASKPKASAKTAAPSPKAAAPSPKAAAKAKATPKPKAAAAAKTTKAAGQTTKAAPKAATKAVPSKAAAKPKTAKAAPKAAAKPKAAARTAPKPVTGKPAAKAAAAADPMAAVRHLDRVRQAREFTGKKVTKAELDAITEVARWSGSSRNEQPLRFVALRNQDRIRQIAEIGLPQTRGLPTATAAVAIVEPNEPERGISRAFDDGRAAERMLIAAHALGLGGGISRVRPDVREGINKVLNLPSNRSVRTIVALGHPTEDALAPKAPPGKARLPREELIYEEQWPDPPVRD